MLQGTCISIFSYSFCVLADAKLSLVDDNDRRMLPGDSEDKLLLWCNSNKDRRFIIIDAGTGTVHNDIPCMGHRVLCAAVVGQRIWLGTEVGLVQNL